jgi:hypothetical protein
MNLDTADHHNSHGRLDSTRPQPGEASERARARGTPFSFYQLHKWSTIGPPFKLVKILIGFQCGIESLTFICGPF